MFHWSMKKISPKLIACTEKVSRANSGVTYLVRNDAGLDTHEKEIFADNLIHELQRAHASMPETSAANADVSLLEYPHVISAAWSLVNKVDERLSELFQSKRLQTTITELEPDDVVSDVPQALRYVNQSVEASIFAKTPLQGILAKDRDDLVHLWALIGRIVHRVLIPSTHIAQQELDVSALRSHLRLREPSLGQWAGPGFEQTVLQALIAFSSPNASVVHLPGDALFMEKYIPNLRLYFPPPWLRGFGPWAKQALRRLHQMRYFFTWREVLTPASTSNGQIMPLFWRPKGFVISMGLSMTLMCKPSLQAFRCDEGWQNTGSPNICNIIKQSISEYMNQWEQLM
jgi:hypothetical protein